MTPPRTFLVLGLSALFLSAGNAVQAGAAPSGAVTFMFTSTAPSDFTGSTITLDNVDLTGTVAPNLVAWNLFGGDVSLSSTDGHSFIFDNAIDSFSADTWQGSFIVDSFDLDPRVEYSGSGSGLVPDAGSLDFNSLGDPPGFWTNVAAPPPAVPDSGTTLSLLAVACAGLGACHRLVRRARTA